MFIIVSPCYVFNRSGDVGCGATGGSGSGSATGGGATGPIGGPTISSSEVSLTFKKVCQKC
jgi:hypothetical protein